MVAVWVLLLVAVFPLAAGLGDVQSDHVTVSALASTAPAGRDWWRWAFARALRSAGVSAPAVGVVGLGVLGLSTDLRQADSFTSAPESVTGFATFDRAYPGEGGRPFTVATPADQVAQVLAVARATDRNEPGTTVATRRAVRATAPVIASAGLVLTATFGVPASLPMVEMGVVVAVGVLLQTLLVAPAMLAPMMVGLRRWIWWPSRSADDAHPPAVPDESARNGAER